ncbi:uncharacterized protein LODBEIA_P52030 [Lodderomyces beijingensis]|uniref:ribonuclease T2 n=1 Tax=Lodderomyces beijingensis TaxID=1775926 RepID=A0ABP0ZS64_9ASCO
MYGINSLTLAALTLAAQTIVATSAYAPYFAKSFHGHRTSADSSSEGNVYPVKDCSAFIDKSKNSWSCHNTSAIATEDQCCFENYGILMQAQFWDYNTTLLSVAVNGTARDIVKADVQSQVDSLYDDLKRTFTIHGLWNDHCDGKYSSNCQPDLEVSDERDNLTHLIGVEFNEPELLAVMKRYWINTLKSNVADQASIALWEHEYNKHGTCMNTLNPPCFDSGFKEHEQAVNFYKKTVEIWSQLDTYEFLAAAGIYPTVAKQYKLADVQRALADAHGGEVYVGCLDGAIDEIWYYHNLQGNVLTGTYKAIDSLTNSTCKENVWYIPK